LRSPYIFAPGCCLLPPNLAETPWKPLITCTRHWKFLTVLPTFQHHPDWRLISAKAARRAAYDARFLRLELPIWMKF
jgi:hypothetical protein